MSAPLSVSLAVPSLVTSNWVSTATPRLSWATTTQTENWLQSSAQLSIIVDGTEQLFSVPDSSSQLVNWPAAPLAPRQKAVIRVRVTGTDGIASEWSEPVSVRSALLGQDEWTAQAISLPNPSGIAQPFNVRHSVSLKSEPTSVVLYASAHGVYQVSVNGIAVDDQFLKPGWTTYQKRVLHETTDITDLFDGASAQINVRVAGGWFTESFGFQGFAKPHYGEQPAFAAQLHVTYADGSSEIIASGAAWEVSASSKIVSASIYHGESFDASVDESLGWSDPAVSGVLENVSVRVAPPVRCIEVVTPVELIISPSGKRILDFGQNLVGLAKFSTTSLVHGQTVTLRHAEVLELGELGVRPLREAKATDTYVHSDGAAEQWHATFTFHGFRYVEVDGWPDSLELSDFSALVLHSDMRRTGDFRSSHELLNQLHKNVVWGMRGNFLSLPTDCPQRDERLGWTGDIQVFAPTASFLYDTHTFLDSWLTDLTIEQDIAGNGVVPIVIPDVLHSGKTPMAAWGDAATIVPTVLHERFGDSQILERQLDSMTRWVDSIVTVSSPEWLWEGFFQFGDWLDPTAPPEDAAAAKTTGDLVATAHAFRSADLTVRAAELLGRSDIAAKYSEIRENYRNAFVDNYVTPAGKIVNDAQTAYAMVIDYKIVEDPRLLTAMSSRLAELTRQDGYHIATGFVGTPIIHDALSYGDHFTANDRLMFQTENPSWLYPVTMGATTIWERWDSMLEDGSINPGEMTSFNHYALGAVADWLHRRVAGIAPTAPGYASVKVDPIYLPSLDFAGADFESAFGPIDVGWERGAAQMITLSVRIPANVTAEVVLPTGSVRVGSGSYSWTFPLAEKEHSPEQITLDSSLLAVLENQAAYSAIVAGMASVDSTHSTAWRKNSKWTSRRTLRESFQAFPRPVVEAALEALAKV